MPLNKLIQPGDNPDLTDERKTATFDTDALAAVIKGGLKVGSFFLPAYFCLFYRNCKEVAISKRKLLVAPSSKIPVQSGTCPARKKWKMLPEKQFIFSKK